MAAGLDLQLIADLALSRHMLFNDLSDDEFIRIAGSHVEALNYALSAYLKRKFAFIYWETMRASCL